MPLASWPIDSALTKMMEGGVLSTTQTLAPAQPSPSQTRPDPAPLLQPSSTLPSPIGGEHGGVGVGGAGHAGQLRPVRHRDVMEIVDMIDMMTRIFPPHPRPPPPTPPLLPPLSTPFPRRAGLAEWTSTLMTEDLATRARSVQPGA